MKIKDNQGNIHNFPPSGYDVDFDDNRPRSELHIRCRNLLRSLYPTQRILEEVPLPNERLFLDFFLPAQKKGIEVNGQQHYSFSQFFHSNKFEFAKAKQRDKRKRGWCEMNGITLIELKYDEDEETWIKKIKEEV